MNVRFEGNNGHDAEVTPFPLMTLRGPLLGGLRPEPSTLALVTARYWRPPDRVARSASPWGVERNPRRSRYETGGGASASRFGFWLISVIV